MGDIVCKYCKQIITERNQAESGRCQNCGVDYASPSLSSKTEPVATVLCNVGLVDPAVDEDMLIRAMKKAVEIGLIPKWADEELYLKNWDGMKKVLQAAAGN